MISKRMVCTVFGAQHAIIIARPISQNSGKCCELVFAQNVLGPDLGRTDFPRIFTFEPPDFCSRILPPELFSSFLLAKSRKRRDPSVCDPSVCKKLKEHSRNRTLDKEDVGIQRALPLFGWDKNVLTTFPLKFAKRMVKKIHVWPPPKKVPRKILQENSLAKSSKIYATKIPDISLQRGRANNVPFVTETLRQCLRDFLKAVEKTTAAKQRKISCRFCGCYAVSNLSLHGVTLYHPLVSIYIYVWDLQGLCGNFWVFEG